MCHGVDDSGLVAIAQRCPRLRSLSLYSNCKVTDRGLMLALRAQQGTGLRDLVLSGCKQVSDETVQRVVSKAPDLETIDLTRCPSVTGAGVRLVCGVLDRLRVLRLYAMGQLPPPAFAALPQLVCLEELGLCGCRVEDGPLVGLLEAASPSRLHTLDLTWCSALTDAAARAVAAHCPRLRWLSYFGNTNMTSAVIEALAASPCGKLVHSLDVRGLTLAAEYSTDGQKLRSLFPRLRCTELHH
ncbi:unnamed protein product [Prorocentrum cordatum]|uniref:F-box/LRR-repeat protein 15-like leucin rich repeat domain-containing protein n=1 Tax=Prorocentrum cordatum TaxID=2364126 RepID=A0ABN9SSI2_9DINO|nr:unnamed protein product [Polarella glacialis]